MNNAKQILTESSCLNSAGGGRPVKPPPTPLSLSLSPSLERQSVTPSPRCIFFLSSLLRLPAVCGASTSNFGVSLLPKAPRRHSAVPFLISAPSRSSIPHVVSRQIVSPFCHRSSLPVRCHLLCCVPCLSAPAVWFSSSVL